MHFLGITFPPPMLFPLILLFVLFPFVELALLIKIGTLMGLWFTLSLCLLTGVAGALLARHQGFEVVNKIRENLQSGRLPAQELFDGLCILAGGMMLLTPGLISDLFGLLLLIPYSRRIIQYYLKRYLERKVGVIDV